MMLTDTEWRDLAGICTLYAEQCEAAGFGQGSRTPPRVTRRLALSKRIVEATS